MFELMSWGSGLIDYIEEIVIGVSLILTGAGALIAKGQRIKKEFIELIDSSKPANKDFEKLAADKGLKIAAKLVKWFPKKSD